MSLKPSEDEQMSPVLELEIDQEQDDIESLSSEVRTAPANPNRRMTRQTSRDEGPQPTPEAVCT